MTFAIIIGTLISVKQTKKNLASLRVGLRNVKILCFVIIMLFTAL